MSADDDTELRDLLVQTLEKNGTLAKIRAQLRASVFLALEEQEGAKKKAPLLNEKAKRFAETENGRMCAEVVADFLESLNLDATLSVFLSEFQLTQRRNRTALSTALGLSSSAASDGNPLLVSALSMDHRDKQNDKNPVSNVTKQPAAAALAKPKQTSGDGFLNGASYLGAGKAFGSDHEDNSDDDDFFDSAGRANAKGNMLDGKASVPATVTLREKLSTGDSGIDGKDGKSDTPAKKEEAKSGSSSLSFLGDLPTLSTKNRVPLPSLTKDKGSKDADFLKLLGDSLDDTDRDSSPRDSARVVPGLDLKKLQDPKNDSKTVANAAQPKNDTKAEKPAESAAKVQRKDSSADEEISEEIAEDLEVDDLLDSARSARQLSF